MGNDYFKFKQFEVQQGMAAMKVCTDSCLFGALLPILQLRELQVLDIGTGTGLLSLMYAQKAPNARIDAVELDESAFKQAKENFEASPWKDRLQAIQGDFRQYQKNEKNAMKKYDLIFSNPPFFEGDLKSADNQRNKAFHSTDLGFPELVESTEALLGTEGVFAVLIPFARRGKMAEIARDYGLYPYMEYVVAHTALHDYFRVIQLFSRRQVETKVEEILIRDPKQQYSLKFSELLSPFYLYL